MTPRLETPRLVLRQFASSDWDAISTMLSDPLTIRYMHFVTWTADQRRQWFDERITNAQQPDLDELDWAIVRKDFEGVIGCLSSEASSDDDATVPGERGIGYLLNRAARNQGYMTEALRAVLAYEFDTCGTPRLRATCNVANPASARVMEKVGMRREKTVFDADFAGNSTHWHHYAITKAEYEVRR
ncbi:MAG TPA: GNAT family protein [Thermomicrobiales bacterium]|nr:GNAT family protein [Thermomicrobiales bacterium]